MATYPIKMLRDEDKQAFVPFTNAAAVVDKDNQSLQELMDNGKYKIQNNVTTASAGKGVLDAYQGKVLNDKFSNYVPLSQKGVANGVASLDAEGKVPSAQLPSYVDDVIESYIVSGSTALSSGWLSKTNGGAALTPETGKIYLVMTSGSYQNKQYRWGGSTYVLCNPSDVNSVNGMTGVVTLKSLTIQKNGTKVGDTFNGSADKTINITVPTKVSELSNDSNYITASANITGNAATATKATQDGNGNVIADTYVKKAGDSMSGTLSITSGNLQVTSGWIKGDASEYHNHAFDMGHTNKNSFDFYEYGGLYNFYKSMNGVDTLLGKITDAGWVGNVTGNVTGNASTATKATQDGNGKVIASTYLPLTGGTITGAVTITSAGGLTVNGNAADHMLKTRGIVGNDGNGNINNLYLQYQAGYPIFLGNDAQYTISADGSEYSGTAANAKKTAGTLTIQKNGTKVDTFDGSANKTINITVPTKTSELTNDSNFIKNTTYATTTTAGIVKIGTGLAVADGVISVTGSATAESVEWAAIKNAPTNVSYWTNDSGYITRSNTMTGATSTTAGTAGTVPAPAAGKEAQFLRGDGTWAVPSKATSADSATTATKIGTSSIGDSTRPVYISAGTPTACGQVSSGKYTSGVPYIGSSGVMEIGSHIDFHTNTSTNDFDARLYTNGTDLYSTSSFAPSGANQTLGLSSSPWKNVYASTFNGKLSYIDTTGSTFLMVGSDNKDTTLLRVYSSDSSSGTDAPTTSADYGYSLVYKGTGSENNNSLILYSDNQTGTQVAAMTMLQNGSITLGSTLTTQDIFAKKHIYLNGVASSSVNTTTKIIFGNASTAYAVISANTSNGLLFSNSLTSTTEQMGYLGNHNAFAPGYQNTTATLGCNNGDAKYQWANVYTKSVDLNYAAQIKYNSTNKCIDFIFA